MDKWFGDFWGIFGGGGNDYTKQKPEFARNESNRRLFRESPTLPQPPCRRRFIVDPHPAYNECVSQVRQARRPKYPADQRDHRDSLRGIQSTKVHELIFPDSYQKENSKRPVDSHSSPPISSSLYKNLIKSSSNLNLDKSNFSREDSDYVHSEESDSCSWRDFEEAEDQGSYSGSDLPVCFLDRRYRRQQLKGDSAGAAGVEAMGNGSGENPAKDSDPSTSTIENARTETVSDGPVIAAAAEQNKDLLLESSKELQQPNDMKIVSISDNSLDLNFLQADTTFPAASRKSDQESALVPKEIKEHLDDQKNSELNEARPDSPVLPEIGLGVATFEDGGESPLQPPLLDKNDTNDQDENERDKNDTTPPLPDQDPGVPPPPHDTVPPQSDPVKIIPIDDSPPPNHLLIIFIVVGIAAFLGLSIASFVYIRRRRRLKRRRESVNNLYNLSSII